MCSESQAAEDAYYAKLEEEYEASLELEHTEHGSYTCPGGPVFYDNLDDIPF